MDVVEFMLGAEKNFRFGLTMAKFLFYRRMNIKIFKIQIAMNFKLTQSILCFFAKILQYN